MSFEENFSKNKDENGKTTHDIVPHKKSITQNCKKLSCLYDDYFCTRTLKLDDTHTLEVEMSERKGIPFNVPSSKICQKVENYLLTLDNSLVITDVFAKVIELLELSDADIEFISMLSCSYIETVGTESRIRSKISMERGVIKEYAISKNGETFHVSIDGNWSYLSDNVQISYHPEKAYSFSVAGSEASIININPAKLMSRVKEIISNLMIFVRGI